MTLFGLLKGYLTYKELHGWMQYQENNNLFKKLFGKDKINIPSRSTLHHLLMNTDNNELEKVFRDYFFRNFSLSTHHDKWQPELAHLNKEYSHL